MTLYVITSKEQITLRSSFRSKLYWQIKNIELSLVNQLEKRWWVIGTRRREIHWNLHFAFALPIFLIFLHLWIFTKTSWRVLMIWISAIYGTESAYSVDALSANHLCSRFLKQSISERIVSPQLLAPRRLFFALRIKRVTWQDASQASLSLSVVLRKYLT